jgi:hypothetical protein
VTKSLLDRQARLLDHLTSGAAIFGDETEAPLDQALRGINPGLLRLEAGLSHEKRISKVVAILPRTFELLGGDRGTILREFTDACPPAHIDFIENARQFHGFLCSRHEHEPPKPPYLHEVAGCELALAEVRVFARDRENPTEKDGSYPRDSIRRRAGVNLLRCAYDIQPIFATCTVKASPTKRDTPLAIVMLPGAGHPKVFELAPAVFDLLAAIHNWSDFAALGTPSELKELIHELTEYGLLEVHA